jgi:hypothetical protein
VPLIIITFANHVAVTPTGKPEPVRLPMPVALVVVCVIFGVNAVLTVSVGVDEAALAVLSIQGVTVVVVVILGEGPTAFVAKTEKT